MKYRTTRTGFTLLETLVAISVLMLAIVTPMSFVAQNIRNAIYARDQITAFYLAQEGVELARARRDSIALHNSTNWLLKSSVPVISLQSSYCQSQAAGCGLDTRADFITKVHICTAQNGCPLNYSSGSDRGLYTHYPGNPSQFNRIIHISEEDPNRRAKVTSTVTWKTGPLDSSITVEGYVFNQYDNIFNP